MEAITSTAESETNTADTSTDETTAKRMPLGMSSFVNDERERFGRNIRLAMACIEGESEPVCTKALPSDEQAIRQRLKVLSGNMTSQLADLIELLVRFDDLQGWKISGAKHCAAWMNVELGISVKLGWEYLRVGRKLRQLPTTTALFRASKLTWSKVRLMISVADKDNEKILCHAALDASVSDVRRLCEQYRWQLDSQGKSESERAMMQWEKRSFTWKEISCGGILIQWVLPPETAQVVLNSVEHSLNQLKENQLNESDADYKASSSAVEAEQADDPTSPTSPTAPYNSFETTSRISQLRADAAVLMAESSLQAAGRDIAVADRYQVIVSVDATELIQEPEEQRDSTDQHETLEQRDSADQQEAADLSMLPKPKLPSKRPMIRGGGAIARETARRIACDCSLTTNTTKNGAPTDIGRRSRLWRPAMARAIKERDQHCQFYGCTQVINLQIHHIKHWADGGTTCMSNGVCVCQYHHTLVHEGGYRFEIIVDNEKSSDEQFLRQQRVDDTSLIDIERELRNDRDSFDAVRRLSPTRNRFRIVDAEGSDILSSDSRGAGSVELCTNKPQWPLEESIRIDSGMSESSCPYPYPHLYPHPRPGSDVTHTTNSDDNSDKGISDQRAAYWVSDALVVP